MTIDKRRYQSSFIVNLLSSLDGILVTIRPHIIRVRKDLSRTQIKEMNNKPH